MQKWCIYCGYTAATRDPKQSVNISVQRVYGSELVLGARVICPRRDGREREEVRESPVRRRGSAARGSCSRARRNLDWLATLLSPLILVFRLALLPAASRARDMSSSRNSMIGMSLSPDLAAILHCRLTFRDSLLFCPLPPCRATILAF